MHWDRLCYSVDGALQPVESGHPFFTFSAEKKEGKNRTGRRRPWELSGLGEVRSTFFRVLSGVNVPSFSTTSKYKSQLMQEETIGEEGAPPMHQYPKPSTKKPERAREKKRRRKQQ